MKKKIIDNLENPDKLERLYRDNKDDFTRSFKDVSAEYDSDLVRFWKIRLSQEKEVESKVFLKSDLLIVVVLSLVTGFLVKIPAMFPQVNSELFYFRNLAVIVFNGLILFTFWQNKIFDQKKMLIYGSTILILLLFVNFLPDKKSDSINLAFIHIPLLLWCLFGLTYVSFDHHDTEKRIEFIRFNGEFIVMTGLILIAGVMLTAVTIGLFHVIKMDIEKFYQEYVLVFCGVAVPIVASWLLQLYPNITSKIAPVIARVFTPLVLITLVVYLVLMIFSQTRISEDREVLLLFNVMLVAVMAIIVFSITELDKYKEKDSNVLVLFLLAIVAIVINSIALVAIVSRLSAGFTPNRTVVLVSNILVFVNLILIARSLYQSYFKASSLDSVGKMVAKYLTVYFVWTLVVIIVLPFVFGFK